jgi:signal transduction histidine kinase
VDRGVALIEDLLALARHGEPIGEVEPVSLPGTVDDCWRTVETGDARLVARTGRTVRADPGALKQLLENLFRNAVEHGDEAVTVTVGDLDGGFYVTDDGPGIPEGEREQVFEAGYSTADGGPGLGLSIVHEIVEAHGWNVRIAESETGGTRFELTGVDILGG